MPEDKSLLYYGAIYHRLFDPQLAEARQITVDLIAEGSSVLDIGCGTGLLCFVFRGQKHCRLAFASWKQHSDATTIPTSGLSLLMVVYVAYWGNPAYQSTWSTPLFSGETAAR